MTADGRHAIAERNAAAIRDAALHVLARSPAAGLAEIAAAAGLGRATVYRHFPNREALLEELRAQADRATAEVAEAALRAGEHDLRAGLLVLVAGLGEVADRFTAIIPTAPDELEAAARDAFRPLFVLVARAQAEGRLDPSVDPHWLLAALRGLLVAARRERLAGRLTREATPALVVRTVLDGVGA